jgi:hypothetical protein
MSELPANLIPSGSLQRPLATHSGVIAETQAPRSGWQNTFLHG